MSSVKNSQLLNWAQSCGYIVDEDGTARHSGQHIPIPSLPPNVSQHALVFLSSLSSSLVPKPTPVIDYGEQYGDEIENHCCLHRAPFQKIESLSPFVVLMETGYGSIFPGCRHVAIYRNYLDVIVHIFQEHLEKIDKDYYCIACNRQYIQKQDAKRHARTATQGAVYVCDSCSHRTTRKDSLLLHKRDMH